MKVKVIINKRHAFNRILINYTKIQHIIINSNKMLGYRRETAL